MSTTSRYLFPPMLKTVRRAPRKLAVGKSARSSCGDRYFRPFRIQYHASSGTFASAYLSPNSRRAFLEMIRNAPPQPAYSHTGNLHSQYGNIGSFGQSLYVGSIAHNVQGLRTGPHHILYGWPGLTPAPALRARTVAAGWVEGRPQAARAGGPLILMQAPPGPLGPRGER